MSPFMIIFDGYKEPDEYDTYDEALAVADEMVSNASLGSEILYGMNPGDFAEENDGESSYEIIEVDEFGNEIDRY